MIDIEARNKWMLEEALGLGSQEANRVLQAAVMANNHTLDPLKAWLLAAVDAALDGGGASLTCNECSSPTDCTDIVICEACADKARAEAVEEHTRDLREDFEIDRRALEDRISDLLQDAAEGTTDATLTELRQVLHAEKAKRAALERALQEAIDKSVEIAAALDVAERRIIGLEAPTPAKKPRAPRKPKPALPK